MARRPLTDAQLARRTPEQQAETLKKRRQRAEKKKAALAPQSSPASSTVGNVAHFAAPTKPSPAGPVDNRPSDSVPGIEPAEIRARQMYDKIRAKMQRAGIWNDEGSHGPLLLYCKSVVAVEEEDVKTLPASVVTQVSKLHAQLGLANLPADREAKASRFGSGAW
jgi:hypothetical protein